jgi:hypothetical protein
MRVAISGVGVAGGVIATGLAAPPGVEVLARTQARYMAPRLSWSKRDSAWNEEPVTFRQNVQWQANVRSGGLVALNRTLPQRPPP